MLDDDISCKLKSYYRYYRKSIAGAKRCDTRTSPIENLMNLNFSKRSHLDFVPDTRSSICLNDDCRLTNAIRMNEHDKVFVTEGLIKTYPVDVLARGFRNWFKKNVNVKLQDISFSDIVEKHWATREIDSVFNQKFIDIVDQHKFDEQSQQPGLITFYIPFTEIEIEDKGIEDIVKELVHDMYVHGYNISSYDIIDFDDNYVKNDYADVVVIYVTFEAKFADVDFEMTEWLYHVTPYSQLKKICIHGLVPRSNHSFYDYPDRVYLFNDCDMSIILDYAQDKADHKGDDKFALLKIRSDVLKNDESFKTSRLKFYVDQKYFVGDEGKPQAIFTYNNVKRQLIDDEIIVFKAENQIILDKKKMRLSQWK